MNAVLPSILLSGFLGTLLPAQITVDFNATDTGNLAGPIVFSVGLDETGNAYLVDGASAGVAASGVSGSVADASLFASSFTVILDLWNAIDVTTGQASGSAGSSRSNSLGVAVSTNPAGNFLGNDGLEAEGIMVSLDTQGFAQSVSISGIRVNSVDASTDSVGVFVLGSGSTTYAPYDGSGTAYWVDLSALELGVAAGTSSTALATVWQPATGETGIRLDGLEFQFGALAPIPEPSFLALALGLAASTVLSRRRR